ncbi:hypothetical protein UlMin_035361 [Ulmus minor]
MWSNVITRAISKHCLRLSGKRIDAAHVGGFTEPPFISNQTQQRRAYAQYFRFQASKSFRTTVPSRSFSSSSPSSTKIGFVGWYLGKLEARPLLTKGISTSLVFAAADLTSQAISSPASFSFDSIRMLRMAAYGLLILGPSQHLWFNLMSKIFPKRNLVATFSKIFMGQALFGPCITSVFFSYNACLQGESGHEIVARLKRDLIPTLINGVMYWPLCDFVTFKFVPVHLQPLMNSSCAYLWTIYLTYMASLKKVSSD